jgi:DMSO/TMAO reductase YedYZ heme-binding membrane subunit
MTLDPKLAWYVARASGLTTWALVAASVVWGLLLSSRAARNLKPAWLTDLHRFFGGLAVVFLGVHLAGLALDNTVDFGPAQMLVPFTSAWRPGAVAWGVVGLYLLVAIEVTSLLMRRIPRRWWKGIHLSSYALYAAGTVHLLTAGSDANNAIVHAMVVATTTFVGFLTGLRLLALRQRPAASSRAEMLARARASSGDPAGSDEGGRVSRLRVPA